MRTTFVAAAMACLVFALFAAPHASAQSASPGAAKAQTAKPKSTREPTAGQMAARERQKKCGMEWREAKAAGKTTGQKWPQFWSSCNARLKGNAA